MTDKTLSGMILDEQNEVTLEELMQACCCESDWLTELINEGILDPIGEDEKQWCFTSISVLRVRTAMRLQQDLGINLAGVALAFDLMQEIENLQVQVDRLENKSL